MDIGSIIVLTYIVGYIIYVLLNKKRVGKIEDITVDYGDTRHKVSMGYIMYEAILWPLYLLGFFSHND